MFRLQMQVGKILNQMVTNLRTMGYSYKRIAELYDDWHGEETSGIINNISLNYTILSF